jgi:hypothetical protein
MSNVVIGIIGVILFIGLALAGALFLGPHFQSVRADSDASAYMLQLKQVTEAASLRNLQAGSQIGHDETDVDTLRAEGYTKAGLEGFDFTELDGGSYAQMAYKAIPDTTANRRICHNIQRNMGQIASNAEFRTTSTLLHDTTTVQGCIVWKFRPGTLALYTRI